MAATIKDIAQKTGLGLATISSYLNGGSVREKNRLKIEAAIAELDFAVNEMARGLKTNRSKNIGVIIPELDNTFCARIISEVTDNLRTHGYATMICDCRTDEKREADVIEFLLQRRVDGIIIMPTEKTGKLLKQVLAAGKPVVVIDRRLEHIPCAQVLVDNQGAAYDAVLRFIQSGHKNIGMIGGPTDIYTAQERYKGYQKALAKYKYSFDKKYFACGDYTITGGARAMKELLQNNADLDAVFVANYEMTVGAMIELNEQEIKIPEQLSLIGFDNLEFAKASNPSLSVVIQPLKEIAEEVSRILLSYLEHAGEQTCETVILPTYLKEGRSIRK
ncbi:MAG: LacI family transcriptional regulator [Lachnospiraceae bacterium]|nr:LacI family transcriptional regulator [Lachnospiraceae bacterium]